ncbi:leucine-rich repeat flightless-interacting protein 2-like [Panonychus citri]|uniref:leucine-rich repeat flightless-interacting protein 2-like n=1 Tax=Panonychus citri TaxID=50023 RepID=UPI002307BF5B|nr:leucine-rich repeat flightless-interacting protein 2-like [Panonychus citri]XP_053213097.1 leucine-rich repeat flightless-interacting protein 2-like [Panonychus citri]XP_053213099.1 leucine-rich repeat flightless-interacting protein 2-like [Panonychus citri]
MDNLVPILLYIRNFREYRHRDCRDASPRFLVRESLRQRARNRSSVSTTSTSSPSSSLSSATPTASNSSSFASSSSSSSTVNLISLGRSPSFRYKMQQVGEEIKELEKEVSPEIDRSTAINRIDSTSLDHHHHHQSEDQDYGDDDDEDENEDYSKLINIEDEGFPENFQNQMDEASNDIEERYRRVLLANTLLDNERHTYSFEGENLREEFNTLEDDYLHGRRLLREKTRTYDLLKRDHAKLKDSCVFMDHCINQRDDLFEKNGLSYLQLRPFRSICDIKTISPHDDKEDGDDTEDEVDSGYNKPIPSMVLINDPSNPIDQFVINFFNQYDQSTLEEQLKSIISERMDLKRTAERLREEVEEKRKNNSNLEEKIFTESYRVSDAEELETQQENIRLLKEYRDKLSITGEEIKRLKEKLTYLEKELDQLKRNHQNSEKSEVTLNKKKRQSLRQLREVEAKIGELEGLNNLLYKKLDKIKKSKYVVS